MEGSARVLLFATQRRQDAYHPPPTTLRRRPAPRLFATLADAIAGLRRDLFGAYRPERHYMRGPGPAWHTKQAMG